MHLHSTRNAGYIPSTAPAYLTIGNVRVTGKFFAYAAVLVVSHMPSFFFFGLLRNFDHDSNQSSRSCSHSSRNTLNLAVPWQLALHDTHNSAMSAGCGVVVALLYWSNLSPLQSFRIPGRQLFAVRCILRAPCGTCPGVAHAHWRVPDGHTPTTMMKSSYPQKPRCVRTDVRSSFPGRKPD